jgi:signal transduction histidine kinase
MPYSTKPERKPLPEGEWRDYIAEIEQQNLYLAEADRLKNEFLNNMSHELRTPLNAIIGFSELLAEGIPRPLDPEQQQYARDILDAGKQLLGLVNDILTFSRSEAGELELHLETVVVEGFLERRIKAFQEVAERKNIQLNLSIEPGCTIFLADREYLRTIVDNLLSNAVKFTGPDGVVNVSARLLDAGLSYSGAVQSSVVAGRRVEIEIADNGIGIAAQDMERLFQPFRQVDGKLTRSASGAGLGLALMRRLVELHDGTLEVQSTPGVGSIFKVQLPWRAIDDFELISSR